MAFGLQLNIAVDGLLIRGDARLADIYVTEYDRVFRHFYPRDVVNDLAKKKQEITIGRLDTTDSWWQPYFGTKSSKAHKRRMFFKDPATK